MTQPTNKSIEDVEKRTLLKGLPEIMVTKLVRRAHSAQACPHKGNCLNEVEMINKLSDYLKRYVQQSKEEVLGEVNEILTNEIALAHTTTSGKTSRLTSALNRINSLSDTPKT